MVFSPFSLFDHFNYYYFYLKGRESRGGGWGNPSVPSTPRQSEVQRREKQPLLYDPEKEISNTIRPWSLGNCVVINPTQLTQPTNNPILFLSLFLSLGWLLVPIFRGSSWGCKSNPTFSSFHSENHNTKITPQKRTFFF